MPRLQCVGTSATLSSMGTFDEQRADVARVASNLFGAPVLPPNVIGETLRRATTERDLNDPAYVGPPYRPRGRFRSWQPPVDMKRLSTIRCRSGWRVRLELPPKPARPVGSQRGRAASRGRGCGPALNDAHGRAIEQCGQVIEAGLMAGYQCQPDPHTGFSRFRVSPAPVHQPRRHRLRLARVRRDAPPHPVSTTIRSRRSQQGLASAGVLS